MIVTCKSNFDQVTGCRLSLMLGKKYDVISIESSMYSGHRKYEILDEEDQVAFYTDWFFKTESEVREEILNELGI